MNKSELQIASQKIQACMRGQPTKTERSCSELCSASQKSEPEMTDLELMGMWVCGEIDEKPGTKHETN